MRRDGDSDRLGTIHCIPWWRQTVSGLVLKRVSSQTECRDRIHVYWDFPWELVDKLRRWGLSWIRVCYKEECTLIPSQQWPWGNVRLLADCRADVESSFKSWVSAWLVFGTGWRWAGSQSYSACVWFIRLHVCWLSCGHSVAYSGAITPVYLAPESKSKSWLCLGSESKDDYEHRGMTRLLQLSLKALSACHVCTFYSMGLHFHTSRPELHWNQKNLANVVWFTHM